MKTMDKYTQLARNAVEAYIKDSVRIKVPDNLPGVFYSDKKGVFVTIYTKLGQDMKKKLRGCVGTFLPTKENIAQEIIDNAISAAVHDCRFGPVQSSELEKLQYEVSLLSLPEQVSSIENLDPQKYGVIVRSTDGKTGLLLPGIDGVETPAHQISIACQKAGIDPGAEKIELFRFMTEKHK